MLQLGCRWWVRAARTCTCWPWRGFSRRVWAARSAIVDPPRLFGDSKYAAAVRGVGQEVGLSGSILAEGHDGDAARQRNLTVGRHFARCLVIEQGPHFARYIIGIEISADELW